MLLVPFAFFSKLLLNPLFPSLLLCTSVKSISTLPSSQLQCFLLPQETSIARPFSANILVLLTPTVETVAEKSSVKISLQLPLMLPQVLASTYQIPSFLIKVQLTLLSFWPWKPNSCFVLQEISQVAPMLLDIHDPVLLWHVAQEIAACHAFASFGS